jgi:hypothetical protein
MLKNKLQFTQTSLDDATRERDKLKEVNKYLSLGSECSKSGQKKNLF